MKNNQQLINNMIGQLNGIARMIEEEKDCQAVITQMKAVRSAVASLMNRYIEEKALSCLDKKGGKVGMDREEMKKLIKELANK